MQVTHIGRQGHAIVNLPIKFEVPSLTRYGDMKGVKNAKMGWFGWLGVTQGHRQCHHSIEHIPLPIRL